MSAVTADALREAILPLLAAAGWEIRRDNPSLMDHAKNGTHTVYLAPGRLIVDRIDPAGGWSVDETLAADVTSVEQALAYLRVAGVLPPAAPMYNVVVTDTAPSSSSGVRHTFADRAEAERYAAHYNRIFATRQTYGGRAEVVEVSR